MPLGFLQFEEDDEDVDKQLSEDLKVINADLPPIPEIVNPSTSPFITAPKRKPVFKPEQPTIQEEPATTPSPIVKTKKPLSEKQKAHLEKMRLRRVNKKKEQLEKKMEKTDIVKKVEAKMDIPVIEKTQEEIMEMDNKGFDLWMKNMNKFDKMMDAATKAKERELELILKAEEKERLKEEAIESRIREKIKKERLDEESVKYNKPNYKNITVQPILQQPVNDFGEYSSMFGY